MVLVDQCVPVLCREEGGVSEKEDPVLEPGEEKQRIEDLWNSFKQEAHHGQSDRSCKARCWFVGMLLTKQGVRELDNTCMISVLVGIGLSFLSVGRTIMCGATNDCLVYLCV